ncbi:MAG: glycerol-3-phosphate dehydrogenase/oxidase [Actinomycetaceae bacterium]|nr:glycerol-3-phosphate dehydrogenase/oxidase [Actinomycetaceae bacterium]
MTSPALSKAQRQTSIERMTDEQGLDILVIGGGATGAGIALDAATRGLRVGVVEAQDWASGTSSRSSKLIHGGLRYLYQLDFKLVAEALRERGLLLDTIAPHLVKAQPFLWPLKIPVIERAYSAVGVGMYDALAQFAHRGSVPIQKHYSKAQTHQIFPDVRDEAMIGSLRFYDARVDDARLVITTVRTAVKYGAFAANRCKVAALSKDSRGKVNGATIVDLETGQEHYVKAKYVINSTGVWTEKTQAMAGTTGGLKVLTSKGIHIVIPKRRIRGNAGIFLRTEKSVLFIIPWKRYWVIGTTDTKYSEDLAHPVAAKEDIDYLLNHANAVLKSNLTHEDVIGSFAGLRPLLQPGTIDGDKAKSTKVSREHTVTEAAPGLAVIAGGKLTSYRLMARDAVDFALGKQCAKNQPSLTGTTPLQGAEGYRALWNGRANLADESGLSVDHIEDLLNRYGSDIHVILDSIHKDPTLGEELPGAKEYLKAEVAFALTHEGALHLEDVLLNRVRLSFEHRDKGISAVETIADMCQAELGWNKQQRAREIEVYKQRCAIEEEAEGILTEKEAQALRSTVEDICPMESNSQHKKETPVSAN